MNESLEAPLAAALIEDGHKVLAVRGGAPEVFAAFLPRAPDLVLLAGTNELDPCEVCRELSAYPETRDIPMMIILGLPHDAGRQVEGFRAGAADFIPSPVHLEELRARVRNQLALARARAHMNSAILVCQADRNRLASMVEGSIDALIATDLDGVITDWNQAATDLTGYTAKEGIGQSVAMLVLSGESEVMVADRIRRALERQALAKRGGGFGAPGRLAIQLLPQTLVYPRSGRNTHGLPGRCRGHHGTQAAGGGSRAVRS